MMNNRSASRWGAPHQAGPQSSDSHRGGRRGYDITDGGQIYTHMQHMPDVMIEISYRNYIDIEMYQTMNICQPPHHIDIWLFVSLVLLYAATSSSMNNQMRGYPPREGSGDDRWREDDRRHSGGVQRPSFSSYEYGRGRGEGWRDMEVRCWRHKLHIFAILQSTICWIK